MKVHVPANNQETAENIHARYHRFMIEEYLDPVWLIKSNPLTDNEIYKSNTLISAPVLYEQFNYIELALRKIRKTWLDNNGKLCMLMNVKIDMGDTEFYFRLVPFTDEGELRVFYCFTLFCNDRDENSVFYLFKITLSNNRSTGNKFSYGRYGDMKNIIGLNPAIVKPLETLSMLYAPNNSLAITNQFYTGVFLGKNYKKLVNAFERVDSQGMISALILQLTNKAIQEICNNRMTNYLYGERPSHNKMFMQCMDTVRPFPTPYIDASNKQIDEFLMELVLSTYDLDRDNDVDEMVREFNETRDSELEIPSMIDNATSMTPIPIISFTKREMQFVEKYTEEHKSRFDGNWEPYINHSGYGQALRLKYKGRMYVVTFEMSLNKMIRFMIRDMFKSNIGLLSIAFFNNEDQIDSAPSCIRLEMLVGAGDGGIPASGDELSQYPLFTDTTETTIEILNIVLSTLVVIHDRPTKYVVIQESQEVEFVPEKDNNNKNYKRPEKKIVISHLLHTVRMAKKIVAANQNSISRRHYAMPVWDKVGYSYVNHKGKVVNVKPTTCHRKLPLTKDTEIFLKL